MIETRKIKPNRMKQYFHSFGFNFTGCYKKMRHIDRDRENNLYNQNSFRSGRQFDCGKQALYVGANVMNFTVYQSQ
jgi:hypothetical protein